GRPVTLMFLARHLVLLACWSLVGACAGRPVADDVSVTCTADPAPPVAGARTVATVTLRDAARQPVRGVRLEIEVHMSHPGMAPILAAAEEQGDGVSQGRFRFPMS